MYVATAGDAEGSQAAAAAAAKGQAQLGCSKCRYSSKGCLECRTKAELGLLKPRSPAKANMAGVLKAGSNKVKRRLTYIGQALAQAAKEHPSPPAAQVTVLLVVCRLRWCTVVQCNAECVPSTAEPLQRAVIVSPCT